MVNFMWLLDWAMGCLNICSDIILRVSEWVFGNEIDIWVGEWSRTDGPPWSGCTQKPQSRQQAQNWCWLHILRCVISVAMETLGHPFCQRWDRNSSRQTYMGTLPMPGAPQWVDRIAQIFLKAGECKKSLLMSVHGTQKWGSRQDLPLTLKERQPIFFCCCWGESLHNPSAWLNFRQVSSCSGPLSPLSLLSQKSRS